MSTEVERPAGLTDEQWARMDKRPAVDRYSNFEAEEYGHGQWAVFGAGSDYAIAMGMKEDMLVVARLLNERAKPQ